MNKITNQNLFEEIKNLIEQTKQNVAVTINSSLTIMYWHIGKLINDEILQNKRAEYGKEIVATLSQQLCQQFGKGYSYSALTRMMKFAKNIDEKKLATLSQYLSWSHFRELIKYELESLQNKNFPKDAILKDPYLLDFLELNDRYLEKDLEDAILRNIEQFIFELGVGFSFVERQKRIIIDGEDFKIDLLFYNRKLKRLIAIDLKIGKFKAEYKGQMELYLRWLSKYEKEEGENEPLGIILCANKKEEQIELLEIEKSGIHVAQYLTVLPPKEILEKKLHNAIESAKAKYLISHSSS